MRKLIKKTVKPNNQNVVSKRQQKQLKGGQSDYIIVTDLDQL